MSLLGLVESATASIAVVMMARIAVKRPLWRELRENPMLVLPLLAVMTAAGVLAIWSAVTWPGVRHLLAAALFVVMVAAWWRARPNYGRGRRWPPGSLGMGQSLDAIGNKRFYLEQAGRFGPVFKMSQFGRPVVCILGLDRGRILLANHGTSLAGATLPYNRLIPRGLLRYMPAETHKAIAPLFRTTFSSLPLERLEPEVRRIYRRALSRLAAASAGHPEGLRARPYFERAVFESLARIFYGLASDDPQTRELAGWMPSLLIGQTGKPGWRWHMRAGLAGIAGIMRALQKSWPADPNQGPQSALRSLVASVPEAIESPTYAGNFALITQIAHGDLAGLHDWIFKFCCDHPSVLTPVRSGPTFADGHTAATPCPATSIVMETLRLEQSEFLYRKVTQPIEFEGMVLPAGWLVRLLIQESHLAAASFPDPERFDPARFVQRTYSRTEYSPFGADAHGCMGSQLAHFLGRIFVEELARGYEWRVVRDGPLERGNRHRLHWRPSSRLRVVMTERPTPAGFPRESPLTGPPDRAP